MAAFDARRPQYRPARRLRQTCRGDYAKHARKRWRGLQAAYRRGTFGCLHRACAWPISESVTEQFRSGSASARSSLPLGRVRSLKFNDSEISIREGEAIILAVPPWVAQTLVPGLRVPTEFRAILNAHYSVAPPPQFPPILGLIHGTVEWIFSFPGRLSITISGADRLIDRLREELAADLWRDVAAVTGLPAELPPWGMEGEAGDIRCESRLRMFCDQNQ